MNNRQTNRFPSDPFQTNTVSQFPWLEEDQVQRLKQTVDSMWIKDTYEKQRKEQELYRKVIEAKQQKDTFDKRNAIKNSLYSDSIKQPDPVKRNVWQAQVRMEDLADIVKQKYNLQANAPTNEVLEWFSKMLADQQVDPKLAEDYLNWKSEELLYVSGLKERPVLPQDQQSSDLQTFLTPMASFLQWASDVWQALVWKPIERAAKNTLKLFWFSDEELDWIDTEWDITQYLWQSWQTWWAKLIREWWKIAWTAALTAWLPIWWGIWIWAKVGWKELIKNVALRTLVEWWRWLAETATYNMASTWKAWDPINLWLWAWIAAAIWWPLSLLGSRVIAPWVTKLAEKLQLSGLLNRSRLDRLQTILKQWWSEDLAKWKAEDVANWMFQREIKWTKQQIINKLDDIANWSMELLDDALVNSTIKHNPEWLVDMLNVLKSEYEWWISATVKNKAWNIDILLNKLDTEWWLTLKEINEVKKMINKDLAPYTASGKIKLSKEDIAAANRQLKTYIEWAVEKEWLSEIWVKMLNNEYAMANAMKQAISEKLNTDMIWEILSFVSNRWWTSVWWAILWSQVWPFNNDSIEWKLGNIVFGFAAGRFLWSTQAKTFTAWLLKKLNGTQKAEILNYINKPKSVKLSDKTSKILLNELNKIDDSINLPNNIYDDVNNINVWRSVKSQSESIPQLKATVKAPEDPLIAEARKYKSAEEFIKAQGTPVYHGSPSKIIGELKSSKELGTSQHTSKFGGIFFSEDKAVADAYSKLPNRANLSKIKRPEVSNYVDRLQKKITEYNNTVDKLYQWFDEQGWIVDNNFERYVSAERGGKPIKDKIVKIQNEIRDIKKNAPDLTDTEKSLLYGNANTQEVVLIGDVIDINKRVGFSENREALIEKYKGKIIKLKDGNNQVEYIATDSSQIKTKSQLKQIREQANKTKWLPAKNESIPQLKATVKAPEVDTSYRIWHQIDINKSSPITSIDWKKIDTFVDEFKRQYWYPALKSKEFNKFKEIMKNPEADIKIYRASPKNELNQWDWVTIDKTYANDIKRQNWWKVYEYNVKAKDLLYPNTIEWFNELPSLNKRWAFQYNGKWLKPKK